MQLASRRGLLIILSSPSGAGKTTLARKLMGWDETLSFSVSATTRPRCCTACNSVAVMGRPNGSGSNPRWIGFPSYWRPTMPAMSFQRPGTTGGSRSGPWTSAANWSPSNVAMF